MYSQTLSRPDGTNYCQAEYDTTAGFLRVTWWGFVTAQDGERGAEEALKLMQLIHVPWLLNDNSQVVGPWFDSVEWLERVWAPQAERLGLRAVAHVMQPNTEAELGVRADHNPFAGHFDLQLFSELAEAEHWLRAQQRATQLLG